MKPRIAVLLPEDDPNFLPDDRLRLCDFAEVAPHRGKGRPTDDDKIALMSEADGAILGRGAGGLTKEIIEQCAKLRIVGLIGGSVRMIEPEVLLDRGVTVVNTAYAMTDAVAEFNLALILNSLRDIPHMIEEMRGCGWGQARGEPKNLKEKVVALIGYGLIARRVRELLKPFHCPVLVVDPYLPADVAERDYVTVVPLDEALAQADVISLHVGLTPETEGMIGEKELKLIQDGALIVNTARGKLLDEDALARELKTGRIFASLNVFAREPLPMDSPLRGAPNVILTPHGAGKTVDTWRIQSEMIVDDMRRFFSGETPKSLITREMLGKMT
ncbi:MAG: hydroxyacid dehydrogenase [Planctomycetes bacterium]|nr:hydroxyacid dehydrogenase [Planctomycetota bacterium]